MIVGFLQWNAWSFGSLTMTCGSFFYTEDILNIRIQYANKLYFMSQNETDLSLVTDYYAKGWYPVALFSLVVGQWNWFVADDDKWWFKILSLFVFVIIVKIIDLFQWLCIVWHFEQSYSLNSLFNIHHLNIIILLYSFFCLSILSFMIPCSLSISFSWFFVHYHSLFRLLPIVSSLFSLVFCLERRLVIFVFFILFSLSLIVLFLADSFFPFLFSIFSWKEDGPHLVWKSFILLYIPDSFFPHCLCLVCHLCFLHFIESFSHYFFIFSSLSSLS